MSTFLDDIKETKRQLDKVSPSFCLAKWLQVTIHLHSGYTHSCHHPIMHKIPLDELKDNPSALHNTPLKKEQRKMMLEGKRPPECGYCWNIEDLPGKNISDRMVKSNDYWAKEYMSQVANAPWDANIQPSYVEVSFSKICNFKCCYCSPNFSSSWVSEMLQHGEFPTRSRHHSIITEDELEVLKHKDNNPYIEAFWRWWPTLYPSLKVFRVTGGEPLLSKDTFKVIDEIAAHPTPNPDMELAINSNFGIPTKLVEKLCKGVSPLLKEKKIKNFRLYISLDTWGAQAEYIRSGLDLELFQTNLKTVMKLLPEADITFMCTYNALGVVKFKQFLAQLAKWKKKQNILIDISYLRHPEFMSIKVLPKEFGRYIEESLAFMEENNFTDYEINKLKRVLEYFNSETGYNQKMFRADFVKYFTEIDRRRKVDFLKTFPELKKEFLQWKADLEVQETTA